MGILMKVNRSAERQKFCLRCGNSFPETDYPILEKKDKEIPQRNWICKKCINIKGEMPLVIQRGYPQFDIRGVFSGFKIKKIKLGDSLNEVEYELPGRLGDIYAFAENRLAARVSSLKMANILLKEFKEAVLFTSSDDGAAVVLFPMGDFKKLAERLGSRKRKVLSEEHRAALAERLAEARKNRG